MHAGSAETHHFEMVQGRERRLRRGLGRSLGARRLGSEWTGDQVPPFPSLDDEAEFAGVRRGLGGGDGNPRESPHKLRRRGTKADAELAILRSSDAARIVNAKTDQNVPKVVLEVLIAQEHLFIGDKSVRVAAGRSQQSINWGRPCDLTPHVRDRLVRRQLYKQLIDCARGRWSGRGVGGK